MPFVQRDPLPIVQVQIGDMKDVPFLIDTGAGELYVDDTVAARAGMQRFGHEDSFFAAGRRGRMQHIVVPALGLGGLQVSDVPAVSMDLRAIGSLLGIENLGGIIGTVLFYRLRATIDYPAEALVLRRKQAPLDEREARAAAMPFWLAEDHFVLAEGRLNAAPPALFFVDTGMAGGAAFTGPASSLAAAGIDPPSGAKQRATGAGGSFGFRTYDIASLQLGSIRRENLVGVTDAFPDQLEWAEGVRIGGLISHGFFVPYALTFDFAARQLRLG